MEESEGGVGKENVELGVEEVGCGNWNWLEETDSVKLDPKLKPTWPGGGEGALVGEDVGAAGEGKEKAELELAGVTEVESAVAFSSSFESIGGV